MRFDKESKSKDFCGGRGRGGGGGVEMGGDGSGGKVGFRPKNNKNNNVFSLIFCAHAL